MSRRIFYNGDVNIEHGGYFYTLENFENGYVEAIQVTPCSDAGGPGNVFWVESYTVNIPDGATLAFDGKGDDAATRRADRTIRGALLHDRVERALACVGYESPEMLADWDKRTVAERRHIVVHACLSYGYADRDETETVAVGKPEFTHNHEGEFVPTKTLRANASLRNYVRGKM